MQIFRKQQQYIWSLIGGKYFLIWNNPFIVYSILIQNMGNIGKGLSLLLAVILAVSSLIMIESAYAQSIPKPSIPEFTVKLIDSSYVIPATTTIDPYTGQTATSQSKRIDARTIEVRIKDVQFSPFEKKNGSNTYTAQFYYNIRFKGHFEKEWHEIYNPNVNGLLGSYGSYGKETVLSLQGEYSSTEGLKIAPQGIYFPTFLPNAQIDFQVEAMIGYIHHVDAMPFSADVFEGVTSGWSNTQTITVPETSTSPLPNPTSTSIQNLTPTPTVPEVSSWAILLLLTITLAAAGLLVYHKKHKHIEKTRLR